MGKVTKTSKTFAKKHLQSTISRRKTVQKVKRTRAEQEQKRGAQGIMHAALGAVQSRARRSPAVYQTAMHMLPAGDAAKAPPNGPGPWPPPPHSACRRSP